ncbi:MAG: endo-1,4-beta-xylanase, partial [Nanoarchaeota archaeon]
MQVQNPAQVFQTKTRVDYTKEVLSLVRSVDPSTKLSINDFDIFGGKKTNEFYQFLKTLKISGTPFDVIGIQSHSPGTDRFPLDRVWRILEYYATLGKEIHITELSVPSGYWPITGSWKKGYWTADEQADYASKLYRVLFAHPSVNAIIWWGFADLAVSW